MMALDMHLQQRLPLVTVITPAYNREALLDEVVQSVLDQDYPNVEYVILDDGSTDGTLDVIKKYDDKVKWDSHPNVGEALTVNKGFSMACGEIIGVVNSDDPLLPGAISTMVEHLLARPDALVAYPDWLWIDENRETFQHVTTYEYDYLDMLRWHYCVPGSGAFIRRSVVEELGGRDSSFRFVGDFDFWLRAGLLGPFVRVPETLATFRRHPGSYTSSQLGREMAEEHLALVDKLFATPDLPEEVLRVRREAYSSAYYIAGVVCGEGTLADKRRYFLHALRLAPCKYLTEYRHRWFLILPALLGRFYGLFKRVAKPVFRRLRVRVSP